MVLKRQSDEDGRNLTEKGEYHSESGGKIKGPLNDSTYNNKRNLLSVKYY